MISMLGSKYRVEYVNSTGDYKVFIGDRECTDEIKSCISDDVDELIGDIVFALNDIIRRLDGARNVIQRMDKD